MVWICFLTFHTIWAVILPIDELIFFTGVGSTTNRCQSFFSLNLEISHQNLWRDPMKSSHHGAQAGDVAFEAGVGSPGDFGIGDDSRWLRNLLRILLWKTDWWFGYPIKSPSISPSKSINSITGRWFGTWILFSPRVGDDDPIWLIFLRGVGIPPIRKCWDGLPIWKSNRLASDFEEPLFFRILSWNGESEDLIQRSCDLAWFDYPRMEGDSEFLQISTGWFIQLRNIHSNYPIIPDNSAWLRAG